MRLIFDVDGVVCNFEAHWRQIAECATGHVLIPNPNHADAWKMEERYILTLQEREVVQRELYTTSPEFMQPIDGAIPHLHALGTVHELFFATTSLVPNPLWEWGRRRWFKRELGSEYARRLIFTRYKCILSGDVLIDDKLRNIKEWNNEGNPRGILFGAINGDKADATTWPELAKLIATIGARNG